MVIVGGSCAGSAAGRTLAGAGKNVLIIDKAVFPRPKLCGGMITEKTVSLLTDVYGVPPPEGLIVNTARTYGIYERERGKICKFTHPTSKFYFVDRIAFDNYYLRQAEAAGCRVMTGARVAEAADGGVALDDGRNIKAPVVIGADGANSVVRKGIYGTGRKKAFTMALEADVQDSSVTCFNDGDGVFPRIYFGFVQQGYGWVFPKNGFATIGLGAVVSANPKPLRDLFNDFMRSVSRNGNGTGSPSVRVRGFPVPVHNFVRRPGRGRVLLAGDAAGLVEPLTGEGIYFAVLSGKLAARAILDEANIAAGYNAMVGREIHPVIRQAAMARRLYFHPRGLNMALTKMRANAKYCKYYIDLLSGDIDYKGYLGCVLSDRNIYASE